MIIAVQQTLNAVPSKHQYGANCFNKEAHHK